MNSLIDPLTGLPSQTSFLQQADNLLERACIPLSLIYIDPRLYYEGGMLNSLEESEKILLHLAEVLRSLAAMPLRASSTDEAEDGLCGRLSSGIFVLLIPTEREQAALDTIIHSKLSWTRGFFLPAIGIAHFHKSDPHEQASALCHRAGLACSLRALDGGIAFYDEVDWDRISQNQVLLEELPLALERKEFSVYFQPQYELRTGKMVGAEALARWIHPILGRLLPDYFIPLVNKCHMLREFNQYIWDFTASYLKNMIHDGIRPLPISINLSPEEVHDPEMGHFLEQLPDRYGLSPRLLPVELTESAWITPDDDAIHLIKRLRKKGFCVMMDDFGSGFSSLSRLASLPVDTLKLDMSFLETDSPKNRALLSSILSMGRSLNLNIIPEGIETKDQAELLMQLGYRYGQGFYYSHPLSPGQYRKLMEKTGR